MKNIEIRKKILENAKSIIVKAGSRLLTSPERIAILVGAIAELKKKNYKVLLVSSGAVAMGMQAFNLTKRPKTLAEVQALAAVGQSRLMSIYNKECIAHGFRAAQILLTASDTDSKTRSNNVMNCINALWENNVLPVVNENDSVSVNELKFGDNDSLAAAIAELTESELTIILTTEEGLRERKNDVLGNRISVVEKLDKNIFDMAIGTDNEELSIGGMKSKLCAAKVVNSAGLYLWVADGRNDNVINDILDAKDIGTVFVPEKV